MTYYTVDSFFKTISIPVVAIEKVTKTPFTLTLFCKGGKVNTIRFATFTGCKKASNELRELRESVTIYEHLDYERNILSLKREDFILKNFY